MFKRKFHKIQDDRDLTFKDYNLTVFFFKRYRLKIGGATSELQKFYEYQIG